LGQTIKVGWEKMNEEERKTILELASLSKQLKKQLKKFLGKTEIKTNKKRINTNERIIRK